MPDLDAAVDHIEDDVLRLMFLTCHPVLPPESRAALTLRLVGGLTTSEIARAFLVKDATIGQRISRAKRTLAETGASFDLPTGDERDDRLADVMAVIYLIFNEGYTATAGDDWMRPDLCLEALRLARMLAALAPTEPEVHGLQALLEIQASRTHARRPDRGTGAARGPGPPALGPAADPARPGGAGPCRSRWGRPSGRTSSRPPSPPATPGPAGPRTPTGAASPACTTRWQDRARPVVEVNRAVAHGRAFGPDAGLAVLDQLDDSGLPGSHLLPSVRGDLLGESRTQSGGGRAVSDRRGPDSQ